VALRSRSTFCSDSGPMAAPICAATYVDKIQSVLGSDPPVRQPTKFEFIINLMTAKTRGLTFPPALRAIADRVMSKWPMSGSGPGCVRTRKFERRRTANVGERYVRSVESRLIFCRAPMDWENFA
jgi:hypothetical protein